MPLTDDGLIKRLSNCKTLPTPPEVAERIIRISQDTTAGAKEMADAIGLDPGLVSRVLKVANSALYARSRSIENLSQAVVLLGLSTMLNLALSLSLVAAMRQRRIGGIDMGLYWRRSLIAATFSRELARQLGIPATQLENYFLAGLLQDIGILALSATDDLLYEYLEDEQADHERVIEIEQARVGADHAQVGGWLLAQWKLPEYAQVAVGASHVRDADKAPAAHKSLVLCTATSGYFADIWIHKEVDESCAIAAAKAQQLLQMAPATSLEVIQNAAQSLGEMSELFGVELGNAAAMASMLNECEQQLAA